jgi:hypothetical protein
MAIDNWGVMPGLEEDEFVLASRDLAAGQGQPFMRMSDPMSEEDIRKELKNIGASGALVDIAIAKAKEEWRKSQ